MFATRHLLALAALTTTALAQLADLSASCNSTIAALGKDSAVSSCLGVNNLEAIATLVLTNSSTSLVGPINTWIAGICSAPECSSDTLASIASQLKTGCELEVPAEILKYYPTARKVICLQEGSTNCITKTLTSIEKDLGGTLSVQTITGLTSSGQIPPALISDTAAYCTDCTKAIYNTIANDVPEFSQAGYGDIFQQQCGASFTDGNVPSTISESFSSTSSTNTSGAASTTTTGTNSGALSAFSTFSSGTLSGLGASGFVVVSTAFAFLI